MPYHAFISYSHAADGKLAPALQAGLHRFARPWYRLRAARVFRDQSTLAVTPALWDAIRQALDESAFFIFLASPEAAASKWVQREIEYWLTHASAERLLIVLTDGELRWSDEAGDFDASASTALPAVLRGRFHQEPLHLDLRWARRSEHLDLGDPAFRSAVADLAATLYGRPKDELIGEDVRLHRSALRLAWSAVAVLIILLVLAVGAAIVAVSQRDLALTRQQQALARQLAIQSERIREQQPQGLVTSALLAVEASRRFDTLDTAQALRGVLALLPPVPVELGSGGWGSAVRFSPDGDRVAMAADDRLSVFAAGSGEPVFSVDAPGITGLALSPDGGYVAMAMADDVVGIVSATDGTPVGRPLVMGSRPAGPLMAAHPPGTIAFSADGRWLASGTRLLRTGTDEPPLTLPVGQHVRALVFSPDGRHLAVGAQTGIALVWDLAAGAPRHALAHDEAVVDLDFSPDSRRLVTASGDRVTVWSMDSGRSVYTVGAADTVEAVAFSPDGALLATAQFDHVAQILDARTGDRRHRLVHDRPVNSVAFSADGALIATSSYDDTARVWRVGIGEEVWRGVDADYVVTAAIGPDGARVLTSGITGTRLWRLERGGEALRYHHRDATVLTMDPSGRLVATASHTHREGAVVVVRNLREPRAVTRIPLEAGVIALAFGSSDERLAVAGDDGLIRIRDLVAGDEVHRLDAHHHPYFRVSALGYDESGALLAAAAYDLDPELELLRCDMGAAADGTALSRQCALRAVPAGLGSKGSLGFFDGGRLVALRLPGRKRQQVVIQDTATGRERLRIPRAVEDVAYHPGTGLLATADEGLYAASLWRLDQPEPVAVLPHATYVTGVAFSSEGRYLATVSNEPVTARARVALWDVAGRTELARIDYVDYVPAVAFTAAAGELVVLAGDHVRVERWRPASLREAVCARLTRNLDAGEWQEYLPGEPVRKTCEGLP